MNMKKDIYDDASLIKKSLLKDLSEEDRMKLEQLLEDRQLREVYDQLSDPTYLKKQFMEYENYSGKKGYMVFRERRGRARRVNMIRWVAAVAAVWVIVLGSMLWLTLGESGEKEVLPVASKVIPAGEKKARLILADGTEIEVSKTGAHVLKEEGVNIKYENGEISYETERVSTEIVYNELEVPRGGECIITLDDGTKVWVNAETRLKYPVTFVGENREVILEGEAFFDVVKNEKPFIVKTSFGDVRVLGTSFGIVVTFKDGKMIRQEVDVEEFVGWKDGMYVFREKHLGDIMKTLERWYNISVLFEEEELRGLLFTGNLKRYDDINVFFDALTRTGDIKYRVDGNHVILYK